MEIKKEEYYCYSVGLGSTENYHLFVKNFLIYSFKKLISHSIFPLTFISKICIIDQRNQPRFTIAGFK